MDEDQLICFKCKSEKAINYFNHTFDHLFMLKFMVLTWVMFVFVIQRCRYIYQCTSVTVELMDLHV